MPGRFLKSVSLCAIVVVAVGCTSQDHWEKSRPKVVRVHGVVIHNGQPIEDAMVTFHPVAGSYSAFDKTGPDGRFELMTFDEGDGAVPGDYLVAIKKSVVEFEANPADPQHLPPLYHAEQEILPEDYGDPKKSGLTATIPESGVKDLKFELSGPSGKMKVYIARKNG